jgi:hypothetical protein
MGNDAAATEAFIARWQGREGGQERANYSMFLSELCHTLGLPIPDPAGATTEDNDYVFERMVKDFMPDGSAASRRTAGHNGTSESVHSSLILITEKARGPRSASEKKSCCGIRN